jgi:hypothetical protein
MMRGLNDRRSPLTTSRLTAQVWSHPSRVDRMGFPHPGEMHLPEVWALGQELPKATPAQTWGAVTICLQKHPRNDDAHSWIPNHHQCLSAALPVLIMKAPHSILHQGHHPHHLRCRRGGDLKISQKDSSQQLEILT